MDSKKVFPPYFKIGHNFECTSFNIFIINGCQIEILGFICSVKNLFIQGLRRRMKKYVIIVDGRKMKLYPLIMN